MKNSKITAIILSLTILASMTSCGEEESDGLDTPVETKAATTTEIKEADSSEAEITTTTETQSSIAEESAPDENSNNNEKVDPSIVPYDIAEGLTPGESYNEFLLRVKNNMHKSIRNKDNSNTFDYNGVYYINEPFKDSWEKEHNITFTELSPDNCKKNSEFLISELSKVESCKPKIEDGIYVSKFTYNGTEYEMRLGRADKYSEREIQAYQLVMQTDLPDHYTTYFFMSYENGEYIVYPFMLSIDLGTLTAYAIVPVWDLIGDYVEEMRTSILDGIILPIFDLDEYIASQPDWVD